MPQEEGESGDAELYNTVYRSLQKPVRRRLLFNLLEHNPQEALLVPEDVHMSVVGVELDRRAATRLVAVIPRRQEKVGDFLPTPWAIFIAHDNEVAFPATST